MAHTSIGLRLNLSRTSWSVFRPCSLIIIPMSPSSLWWNYLNPTLAKIWKIWPSFHPLLATSSLRLMNSMFHLTSLQGQFQIKFAWLKGTTSLKKKGSIGWRSLAQWVQLISSLALQETVWLMKQMTLIINLFLWLSTRKSKWIYPQGITSKSWKWSKKLSTKWL